jgi:hypothetical protein
VHAVGNDATGANKDELLRAYLQFSSAS